MESVSFFTALAVFVIVCSLMIYVDTRLKAPDKSEYKHCDQCKTAWHTDPGAEFIHEGEEPPSSGQKTPAEPLDIIDTCGVDTPITLKCPTDIKPL